MSKRSFALLYRMLSGFIALCLLSADLAGAAALIDFQGPEPIGAPIAVVVPPAEEQALFRTRVTLRQPRDLERVRAMDAVVLQASETSALLLVTAVQLEDLARLRFEPTGTDELGSLAAANAATMPWLAESLAPALATAAAAQQAYDAARAGLAAAAITGAAGAPELAQPAGALAEVLAGLSAEQLAAAGEAISPDYDGDGLTDTEEAWWCTDVASQDTDADGRQDGSEILALRDWVSNKRSRPPFETPWPNWPPQRVNCPDKDFDSIPNSAERWDLGSSMDLESTDRDRYDDGQEVFGTTYCPGSANACGYGSLPSANHDGIVLFQQLPSWVTAPGNHPLVAALPKLEFEIVADAGGNNFRIQTATVLTIDNRRIENETKHYSTTKTEGTSTSDTETETWENWQEYSKTTELNAGATDPRFGSSPSDNAQSGSVNFSQKVSSVTNVNTNQVNQAAQQINNITQLAKQGGPQAYLGAKAAESADFVLSEACAEVNCKKYVGSAARATVRTILDYPNIIYQSTTPNKCAQDFLSRLKCTAKATATQWKNTFDARVAQVEEQEARDQASGNELEAGGGYLDTTSVVPITFPVPQFTPTQTETSGSSRGGARSTTHTRYEEHSVTEGTSKQFGQEWGTATAENSAHAADLWFAYQLRNVGTDYARQICNIAINVYIGDDEIPAATYYPASDIGGNGCLSNYRPDEAHRYAFPSGSRIALTLEQLKTIDLGGAVRFVIEDFSLGQDDYYTDDAFGGGLSVLLNDGPEDGDDTTESYLIPTWEGDTVLDVVARYLPNETDENGTLVALWTPEYRSDTPAWCKEPLEVGTGSTRTLWCKHALSTADWWNVYTADLGTGAENYENTPASPGGVVLFRFNLDSDGDGYSDRTEDRLGTNPADPSSVPHPQLIAGLHNIRNGNTVETTLSLLNTGLDDAFGIEAVMVAPDDSVQITKNTVGGAGRVRAGRSVVVGSRFALQSPLPPVWNQPNHTLPLVGGYFVGTSDQTYTFTVNCANPAGCQVGSGSWSLAWNNGSGNGSLAVGGGYSAPTLLDVSNEGLKLALLSGTAKNGETFTVSGLVPRDTFQYTITRQDYIPPLVLVRYNDMTGPHHFMLAPDALPLESPDADLVSYSAYMLEDPRLEIVSSSPYQTGQNNTNVLINNPGTVAITDSHVFLEFINEAGVVVAEVRQDIDSPPGPSVLMIPWNTGAFNPAYDPNEAYLAMAIWTDYEGNIIASVARPLLTFQNDPTATLAFDDADLTWDFGTAAQGTLLQRRIVLGSTGYQSLLTHIGGATGVSVTAPAESTLGPADMGIYTLQINTADLAVGPFSATIPIRTSDAANAEKTLTITGTVTPFVPDDSEMVTVRPLDWLATLSGNQGDWVTYSHTLKPNPESLHPVWVRSQDYQTLYGVGEYATDFDEGAAPGNMYGSGGDGDLVVSTNTTDSPIDSSCYGTLGTTSLTASNPSFAPGQMILIHQSRGTGVGTWEVNKIASYVAGTITTVYPLKATYVDSGSSQAQVRVVPQYRNVTINAGVTWTAKEWDGNVGGILAFSARGETLISGTIDATGRGFRGGAEQGGFGVSHHGNSGEGSIGPSVSQGTANGNGGGAGYEPGNNAGAGGSYGTGGTTNSSAVPGHVIGDEAQAILSFGGGGGGGASGSGTGDTPGNGGNGGGAIVIIAKSLTVNGSVTANGAAGSGGVLGGGGGGAGGGVLMRTDSASLGTSSINANGGTGGTSPNGSTQQKLGGNGGAGRVTVEYCLVPPTGSTTPPAFAQKSNCFIAQQDETSPENGRINLPINGGTLVFQYGRRFVLSAAGDQTSSLRVPAGFISEATLSALVSGVGSGDLTFKLDVGDDGTWDWETTQAVSNAAELNSPNLNQAFNAYWSSHGAPTTGSLDVPVRVYLSKAGQVLLTDFEVTYTSSGQSSALAFDNILTTSAAAGMATEVSAASSSDIQRPLDWLATITGAHSAGEWVTYSHTLGPDAVSLHPARVYSADYNTYWGDGRVVADALPGGNTAPLFGTGANGDFLVTATTYGDYRASPLTSGVSTGGRQLVVAYANYFSPGMEVLIIQMQGVGAGQYEFGIIQSTNSDATQLTLQNALTQTFNAGGVNKAQVIFVPQYRNVTIRSGGVYAAFPWNGSAGGVLPFRVSGTLTVEAGGKINASYAGFRGGPIGPTADRTGYQGENETGTQYISENANGVGGGSGNFKDGGGGGGHARSGGRGYLNGDLGQAQEGGYGGNSAGNPELTTLFMGGGGGAGGFHPNNPGCSNGHPGGGIVFIAAERLIVSGEIDANGEDAIPNYYCRAGGAGAGGSILIRVAYAGLGTNLVEARGGISIDTPGGPDAQSGNGSVGRIRVEYCDSTPTGSTDPAASTAKKTCHIAEQVEATPYTQGRLNSPTATTSDTTYAIQYARRLVHPAAGNQPSTLRVPAGAFSNVTLHSLVSGVGSGNVTFKLDIGDDGTWDWEATQNVTNAVDLGSFDLSGAFNAYWSSHGAPTAGTLNVPVRVYLSKAGQVLLTDLQMTGGNSRLRFVRLPAEPYADVFLKLAVGQGGSGNVTVAADVGDDGSVEWTWSGVYPSTRTTIDLAAAFNDYLDGRNGDVDVPVRFFLPAAVAFNLTESTLLPAGQPDLTLAAGDINFSNANPVEGEVVTVTATLHNTGNRDSDGVTAAFFATLPGSAQEWYIGSAFVPDIPASGSKPAPLEWDTLGFNGATTVRVEIDPYERLAEVSDGNNDAGKALTVRRRPELAVESIALSDPEPVSGQALTVAVVVANGGQAQAAAATCALYLGNPDDGGTLLSQQPCGPIAGGGQTMVTFNWTSTAPGPARLFVRLDTTNVVRESDESNNDDWYDAYTGFAGSIQIDSGAAGDTPYAAAAGYGAIDAGTADDLFSADSCSGTVTDEERTMRGDPDGSVTYRFDHLLPAATASSPGHFYHLDLLLLECDGEGRQQTVYVDDIAFRGPYDLGGGAVQRLSLLLDPAFYADHTITVKVKTPVGTPGGALVSSIRLTNIDYRYADAGGAKDVLYPGGPAGYAYGWLNDDGSLTAFTSWGPLPYQTARRDGNDNDVDYRFDGLDPARQYRVNVTLFNGAANTYQESVLIDDLPTAIAAVGLNDMLPHYGSADVPGSAYSGDGSIVVKIRRDNGGITLVSEIALEEVTQTTGQTITPPNVPANPSPADNAAGLATNPTLSWTGGDPDPGDSVTYDVYLDTINPPAQQRADNQLELTFSAGGLAANTLHYWRIVATDNHGATTNGPVWRFTTAAAPNTAPTAPANLSPSNGATNVSKTPQLCWSASSDPDGDPVTYDVYLGASNPPATAVSSNQSGTCYTSGALAGHTTYYWYIVAEDNRGGSTPGVVWSFTTLNTAPIAPSGPNPANGTMGVSTTTQICWSASTDSDNDSVLYDIHLGTTNPPIAEYSGYNGTCYTPLLAANTTYYWRVTAKDAFGGATAGPVWSFTTAALPNNPPNAPTNPSPAPGATGVALTAGLSWSGSDPENDPLTYEVRFGLTNSPPAVVVNQSATAYDPAGNLAAHTTYYWQIVAKDAAHPNGTAGPVWSFTTLNNAPTVPGIPNPVNSATGVPVNTQLCWTASTDADGDAVTYDVAFGTTNPPPAATSGQSATCYDPPGDLSPSTLYYWKVTAKDAFGGSTAGPVWSFTTTGGGTTFLDVFYISPSANVTVGGIAAQPGDVLRYTKSTNTWQMVFDGSDHGMTKNVAAFSLLDDGSLLLVYGANQVIPSLGTATPYDVVKFTPNTPGFPMGAGTYTWYAQLKPKGLTTSGEKIDAIAVTGNQLLLSTGGAASVPKPGGGALKAADEDVFVYNLGTAAFEAALLIDGSKMPGMGAEDITGVWDDPATGDYYVTIVGAFNLGGVKGNDKSIIKLTPNGGATVYSPSLVAWTAVGVTLPTAFKIDGLELAR